LGEPLKERPNVVQRDVLLVKLNLFVTARAAAWPAASKKVSVAAWAAARAAAP
jgi:hypothetical protein